MFYKVALMLPTALTTVFCSLALVAPQLSVRMFSSPAS